MRLSVIIASRNEGMNLLRTVRSVRDSGAGLDLEVVIVDDGSTDDSARIAIEEFPETVVVRHESSLGVSPSRDDGVVAATGDVFIFFDAHVKPEADSLARLMNGIHDSSGDAVVVPMVMQLDTDAWTSNVSLRGFGYELTLDRCEGRWLELSSMRRIQLAGTDYWESPTVVGCSLAVHRKTYEAIMGFDRSMRIWGMEDVDFGIRAWMTGHPVLCNPAARIGHRFVNEFTTYTTRYVDMGANQIRMARKVLGDHAFAEWLGMRGLGMNPASEDTPAFAFWRDAWREYRKDSDTVDATAAELKRRRVMDEYQYADRFQLAWPL